MQTSDYTCQVKLHLENETKQIQLDQAYSLTKLIELTKVQKWTTKLPAKFDHYYVDKEELEEDLIIIKSQEDLIEFLSPEN